MFDGLIHSSSTPISLLHFLVSFFREFGITPSNVWVVKESSVISLRFSAELIVGRKSHGEAERGGGEGRT